MESNWCEECQRLRWLALINDSVLIQHRYNLLPWRAYFKCLELMVCRGGGGGGGAQSDKYQTQTHICSDAGTHIAYTHTHKHTLQTSFCSLGITPTATLHSHVELFSCLTGSRGAVNRPGACQEAGYHATLLHTHADINTEPYMQLKRVTQHDFDD